MSDETNPNEKFQQIENPGEIQHYFEEGVKSLADAMIWTRNQDQFIQTYLNQFDADKKIIRCWCPKGFHGKTLKALVQQTGHNEFFFNLALPTSNIFFKTSFINGDDTALKFLAPSSIFKLQRRSFLRLKLAEGRGIPFRFKDPVFPESKLAKRMMDLSAGGLSFAVQEQEEALFHPGMKLEAIQFTVKEKIINCDGEVRYFHALPPSTQVAGIKIGIRFHHLKTEDSQHIARYVFEESRKHLLKFM